MVVWRAMRDRAMLLTSSSVAFRGDSSRSLLWSDMYCYDVPMNAKGRGEKVRASPSIYVAVSNLLIVPSGINLDR